MPYKEPPAFAEFATRYGDDAAEELLSRICEAHYSGDGGGDGVYFSVVHQHDAINYTLAGSVEHDGTEYGFVIDDGNLAGTVLREFEPGDVGHYTPPPPPRYTMVPINPNLSKGLRKVYEAWKQEAWFAEMVGEFAYDSHFAPGSSAVRYWQEKAAQRGLRFEQVLD